MKKPIILNKIQTLVAIFVIFMPIFCDAIEEIAGVGIAVSATNITIPYSINGDLKFQPCDRSFYSLISNELRALALQFGPNEPISLSNNSSTQKLAPTLWNLLSKKTQTIASRMNLDLSNITICIQPTNQNPQSMFNAHAQTSLQVKIIKKSLVDTSSGAILKTSTSHETSCFHNVTLNAESIKLILWHEGTHAYPETEGLLDGVIAHELGHIFHKHIDCSIECEFEADTTGAKTLLNPNHLIDAVDMLYFAGNCYACLHANTTHFSSWLTHDAMSDAISIISSSLMCKNNGLGYFCQCSTHTQFSHKIQSALGKAIGRIVSKNASQNQSIAISLLYDELKDACLTPLPSETSDIAVSYQAHEQNLALYSQLTHPDPKSRRMHLIASLG